MLDITAFTVATDIQASKNYTYNTRLSNIKHKQMFKNIGNSCNGISLNQAPRISGCCLNIPNLIQKQTEACGFDTYNL